MPGRDGSIILGVDLDGVCADFYGRMREIAAEWFEKEIEDLTPDPTYGLREWGIKDDEHYNSLHRFAVTQRDLFKTEKIIPGARKFIRILHDEGYRIRIITHRLYIHHFHDRAVIQTMEWLDNEDILFWDLCFLGDKTDVDADIYIEDSPSNVNRLRSVGANVICFANSTNKEIDPPRAENWKEVYNLIKAIKL